MKRLLAFSMAILIIFSLCSCGKKDDTESKTETTVAYMTEKDENLTYDFKDDSGRIRAKLDITYPLIESKERPEVAESIAKWFVDYREEQVKSITDGLPSLIETQDRFGIDKPTVTKITCKKYSETDFTVSYTVTEKRGTDPEKDEGGVFGCTFSLETGKRMTLDSLYRSADEKSDGAMKALIAEEADRTYATRANVPISDEQREILDQLFSRDNFCITDFDIVFLYPFEVLSSGARKGIYYCAIDYTNVEDLLYTPGEYNARYRGDDH